MSVDVRAAHTGPDRKAHDTVSMRRELLVGYLEEGVLDYLEKGMRISDRAFE